MNQYPADVMDNFKDIQQNADTFMFNQNRHNMDGIALTIFGVTTTYGQLDKEVDALARSLKGYGIQKGDYVAFCLPNLKEVVLYYYALWRIGAVAVPCDPRTNALGILERVKLAKAKLFITVIDIIPGKLDAALDDIPCENIVVVTPADSLPTFSNPIALAAAVKYKSMKKKSGLDNNPRVIWHTDFLKKFTCDGDIHCEYEKDMNALVLFTSGTSQDGAMKGAIHTHAGLNASAKAFHIRAKSGISDGDTFGGFIPFFASYGVFNGMHMALVMCMNIILVPVYNPLKFDELIFKHKPNVFLGVPRFFEILARSKLTKKSPDSLSFIKESVIGGDKITFASLREINECFASHGVAKGPRVGYGSTEVGGCVSGMRSYKANISTDEYDWDAEGNVGLLLPICEVAVIDPDTGKELPLGQDGELCVSSLCSMKEYLGCPKETEEITIYIDGKKFYRMGDKGHLGENGHFYFVDRYKRSMMRPDGHTVHPAPAENVIATYPDVDTCAVAGLKKEGDAHMAGVIPTAFVVMKKEVKVDDEGKLLRDIDKLCLRHLPERDKALVYKLVDRLPYTPMGKVDFRELEKIPLVNDEFTVCEFAFFPELLTE
ncbi:MAG: acyl--CoA ligase [Oscillospiraceae bacterium]|nr:acyl--CoA ligase [Oscillospiraceae bacterium]